MDLTGLLGKLGAATAQAILPAKVQSWYLQGLEINAQVLKYVTSKTAIRPEDPGGTFLADKKSNSLRRKVSNFTTTRFINDNRCHRSSDEG